MKKLIFTMCLLCLAGCGGGGGGGTASPAPSGTTAPTPTGTTVDLTTFKSIFIGTATGSSTPSYSFPSLVGTDSQGRGWTGSHSINSYGPITFESQSVTRSDYVTVFDLGTVPTPPPYSIDISSRYYLTTNGSFYKAYSNYITTPISQLPFPTTPKVGESGNLGVFKNTNATATTITWALNPDVNGASKFEIKYVSVSDADSTITSTLTYTYYLDVTGNPTKMTLSSTSSGLTVNLSGNRV